MAYGYQQVIELLTAITNRLNSWEDNAKKIDELDEMTVLDILSRIHVSIGGESKRLEIAKLITAIQDRLYDRLIFIGEITLDDQDVTIPENASAQIGGNNYTTSADTVITIPFAAIGKVRKDLLVFNTSSQIVRVPGTEGVIAVRPNVPNNTVVVTEIDVTDDSIGTPSTPVYPADSNFLGSAPDIDTFLSIIPRPVAGNFGHITSGGDFTLAWYTTDWHYLRLTPYSSFTVWETGDSLSFAVSEGVQVKSVSINETIIYNNAVAGAYGRWSQASPGADVVISSDVLFDNESRVLISN